MISEPAVRKEKLRETTLSLPLVEIYHGIQLLSLALIYLMHKQWVESKQFFIRQKRWEGFPLITPKGSAEDSLAKSHLKVGRIRQDLGCDHTGDLAWPGGGHGMLAHSLSTR